MPRYPQTDIGRRMAAGESIPAWRPDTRGQASQHVLKAEPARADATDRDAPAMQSPGGGPMGAAQPAAAGRRTETRPGRDIPAEDARAAAIRMRHWLAHDGTTIDTEDLVTVARWVMHVTKDMPF